MRKILRKELKLSAHILSYLFILFGLMFFLPGYPILCGVFFVCLGIFQSFQASRENNDILFSALLPIAKRDVVSGKFLFVCLIELASLLLMALVTLIRMTVLSTAPVYSANVLMNANGFALGMTFVIFGLFNAVFVGGFFKTAYKFGRPFLLFIILGFAMISLGEALHHVPGLGALNAFGFDHALLQLGLLLAGMAVFVLLTLVSYTVSCKRFETIDL